MRFIVSLWKFKMNLIEINNRNDIFERIWIQYSVCIQQQLDNADILVLWSKRSVCCWRTFLTWIAILDSSIRNPAICGVFLQWDMEFTRYRDGISCNGVGRIIHAVECIRCIVFRHIRCGAHLLMRIKLLQLTFLHKARDCFFEYSTRGVIGKKLSISWTRNRKKYQRITWYGLTLCLNLKIESQ